MKNAWVALIIVLFSCFANANDLVGVIDGDTSNPAAPTADLSADELLIPVNSDGSAAGEKQGNRKRFVMIDFDLIDAKVAQFVDSGGQPFGMKISPFEDVTLPVIIDTVDIKSATNVVMVGYIKGAEESAVTMVVNEGILVAFFRLPDQAMTYEVKPQPRGAQGVHVARLQK